MAGSQAFVQVVEVWEPEGDVLRQRYGAYGHHPELAQISAITEFRKGEGLPGMVWRTGRPEIFVDLDAARFLRKSAARAAGLHAGVGFPIYRGRELVSIVVLFCGSPAESGGCIEVWEPNGRGELSHAEGYYGSLHAFEIASRLVRFPRGAGLPGITWDRALPHILTDVKTATAFIRTEVARAAGLEIGLGVPLMRGGDVAHVLVFLSAPETPLARAFEVWLPDAADRLRLAQSAYAPGLEAFARASRSTTYARGEGFPGLVLASGRALAFDGARFERDAPRHEPAERAGLSGVGFPVHDGTATRAVVLLLN